MDTAKVPPMRETAIWRAIDPRDRHRIDCDRIHLCREHAAWGTIHGTLYVCDYHRFLCDVERTVTTMRHEVAA